MASSKKPAASTKPGAVEPSGQTARPLIPDEIRELLGTAPVLHAAERPLFDRLLAGLVTQFNPVSIYDWIKVHDLACLTWQIRQLRSYEQALLVYAHAQDEPPVTRSDREKMYHHTAMSLISRYLEETDRQALDAKGPKPKTPEEQNELELIEAARRKVEGFKVGEETAGVDMATLGNEASDDDILKGLTRAKRYTAVFERHQDNLASIHKQQAVLEARCEKILRYLKQRQVEQASTRQAARTGASASAHVSTL